MFHISEGPQKARRVHLRQSVSLPRYNGFHFNKQFSGGPSSDSRCLPLDDNGARRVRTKVFALTLPVRTSINSPHGQILFAPTLEVESSCTPILSGISASQSYMQMVRECRFTVPFTCHWLRPGDIDQCSAPSGEYGDYTRIYRVTHNGGLVILKSYPISYNVNLLIAARSNHNICKGVHR